MNTPFIHISPGVAADVNSILNEQLSINSKKIFHFKMGDYSVVPTKVGGGWSP